MQTNGIFFFNPTILVTIGDKIVSTFFYSIDNMFNQFTASAVAQMPPWFHALEGKIVEDENAAELELCGCRSISIQVHISTKGGC